MELEAMQLLNLSPIPELSEIELSTMLDQLSGLNDMNGDLTDRNVEDILKEAEDLLDKSTSNKCTESKIIDCDSSQAKKNETQDQEADNLNCMNASKLPIISINESKGSDTTISTDINLLLNSSNEEVKNKHFNSPVDSYQTKVYSPGGTCNHIRSTIDSLKEFSSLIEKKLVLSSPKNTEENPSPKENISKTPRKAKANEISLACNQTIKSKIPLETPTKKNLCEPLDKSVKLLNCFERLYQDRPVRLSASKKPKVTEKITPKKRLVKDFKNIKKTTWLPKSGTSERIKDNRNAIKTSMLNYSLSNGNSYIKSNMAPSNYYCINNQKFLISPNAEDSVETCCIGDSIQNTKCGAILKSEFNEKDIKYGFKPSNMDVNLMLKVLEEMQEIKDQVKKAGVMKDASSSESCKIRSVFTDTSSRTLSEDNVIPKVGQNIEIKRLEEQFSNLKEKYNCQIEKLEAENSRLKEALKNPQSLAENNEKSKDCNPDSYIDQKFSKTAYLNSLSPPSSNRKLMRSLSLDNCNVPKNSPSSSYENVQIINIFKEGSSQTEIELKTIGTQCTIESKGPDVKETEEIKKKIENKENLKKNFGRVRPFSDAHYLKQKKGFDHESELLATIRGLHSEVSAKEKEVRKLKAEIESLKKQSKKQSNGKVENIKKCHMGTQTIGLGSFLLKPYNPALYEVPRELENENEELRSRIKILEEEFEFLKEKRISDLQSLHQVHEQEMEKLLSKLETQSALTRHLHSLLINR